MALAPTSGPSSLPHDVPHERREPGAKVAAVPRRSSHRREPGLLDDIVGVRPRADERTRELAHVPPVGLEELGAVE